MVTQPTIGRLAIVLHSHLPWLLGYGTWPVGEEWLRQAWAHSYIPVLALLRERAERGLTSQLTLGVTPVLAAQWDDRDSVAEQARWIEDWRLRAAGKALEARRRLDEPAAVDAHRHYRLAVAAQRELHEHWTAGGSAVLRPLVDAGVIELLGGPITHAFTPHLIDPIANISLGAGLDDTHVRTGVRPHGIWAPECAYEPGLEDLYAKHGVTHFVVDGPTLQNVGATVHRPHRIAGSDVVAFGRDLSLTYRVWSPRKGYPGDQWYQDFHAFDYAWGLRSYRVTKKASSLKKAYNPAAAQASVLRDADDFIATARRLMHESPEPDPVVVVAYDTELFGHWWHEGPAFLSAILDKASDAGIELTTLARERARAFDASAVELPRGSWGSGKDFGVWEEGEAGDLRHRGRGAQYALARYLESRTARRSVGRDTLGDALTTELLLGLASDWAFMITKDSAAEYARGRAAAHFSRVAQLLQDAHHSSNVAAATQLDSRLPFLDSRIHR